jgi:hypothetical protein
MYTTEIKIYCDHCHQYTEAYVTMSHGTLHKISWGPPEGAPFKWPILLAGGSGGAGGASGGCYGGAGTWNQAIQDYNLRMKEAKAQWGWNSDYMISCSAECRYALNSIIAKEHNCSSHFGTTAPCPLRWDGIDD